MLKVSSRAFLLGVQVKLVVIYFFTGPFSLGGCVAVVFVGIVVERSLDTFDSIECVSTIGILVLVIGVVVCISLSVMGSIKDEVACLSDEVACLISSVFFFCNNIIIWFR